MIVCITGMHRSGTSMVANMLHRCGLFLGEEDELMPATTDNARGHWEHKQFVRINEDILHSLGGAWYAPPADSVASSFQRMPEIRQSASALVDSFSKREPWGWKDPRNCLTLPFWSDLLSDIKVVICVRNPLEVVESLRRRPVFRHSEGNVLWKFYKEARSSLSLTQRKFFSPKACLELWRIYNERILEHAAPECRIVTHYDTYFRDAAGELARVLRFLEIKASDEAVREAASLASIDLRHNRFKGPSLIASRMPTETSQLYEDLCEESRRTLRAEAPQV